MFVVENYTFSVFLCFITMLCWGSWANTQKLSPKSWPFTLFYWDYAIGVLLFSLLIGISLGSFGESGRPLFEDLMQANLVSYLNAFLGGVVFNLANLIIVAAISIAGMSVAFPIGIGIALVLGVFTNYINQPEGDPVILFIGVLLVTVSIIIYGISYKKILQNSNEKPLKGILISVTAGIAMGFFYKYVAESMVSDFINPEAEKITPVSYTHLTLPTNREV